MLMINYLLHSAADRLASAYLRSRLVPVLGAGMSADRYVTWKGFIENLEAAADTRPDVSVGPALAERAHRALTALRRRGEPLREVIVRALLEGGEPQGGPTPQTAALAKLRWPLVLTTNYDDMYLTAAAGRDQGRQPIVLGRSSRDCQRLLTSLHEPSEPVLWALHGYLGSIAEGAREVPLERELVVGHDEYREVTHTATHFRRAFGEVLRSRSLLFLGCGLDDPHLLSLLEESIALTGASPMPHYAVVFAEEQGAERRTWFLKTRLNIEPIILPDFDALPDFLERVNERVHARRPRWVRWALDVGAERDGEGAEPGLELARGKLPERLTEGECLAVSAGRGHAVGDGFVPVFSKSIGSLLQRLGLPPTWKLPPQGEASARRVEGHPVIVAMARTGDKALRGRDARLIAGTTEAIMDAGAAAGFHTVHAQLLASGRGCPFPRRVSLALMLRGYASWRQRHAQGPRLVIHLVDEDVLQELDAQRIDLLELLQPMMVRFWIEVADGDGRSQRELRYEPLETTVGRLAKSLFTEGPGWHVSVFPGPTYEQEDHEVAEAREMSLERLGVLPGATLRFSKSQA